MPTGNACRGLRRESGSKLAHSKKISSLAAWLGRASLCARETRARTTQESCRATNSRARGRVDALACAAADTAPKRAVEIAKRDRPCIASLRLPGGLRGYQTRIFAVKPAPPVEETKRMRRNLACTGPGTAALGIERASPPVAVEVSMV
jgi:hypothetical protein